MTQMPPALETTSQGPAGAVPNPGKGLSIAGMVLGIVSLVLFIIWVFAIPCSIIGLVLSIIGKGKSKAAGQPRGMAVAGIILSIIALILALVLPLLAVIVWFWKDIGSWFGEAWTTIRN